MEHPGIATCKGIATRLQSFADSLSETTFEEISRRYEYVDMIFKNRFAGRKQDTPSFDHLLGEIRNRAFGGLMMKMFKPGEEPPKPRPKASLAQALKLGGKKEGDTTTKEETMEENAAALGRSIFGRSGGGTAKPTSSTVGN
jgi:hypothetical protein